MSHDHQFAEEETPEGARILFPCLICGLAAADALVQAQAERDKALEDLAAAESAGREPESKKK